MGPTNRFDSSFNPIKTWKHFPPKTKLFSLEAASSFFAFFIFHSKIEVEKVIIADGGKCKTNEKRRISTGYQFYLFIIGYRQPTWADMDYAPKTSKGPNTKK